MKEQLVSFKTAKLAKEKDYKDECFEAYALLDLFYGDPPSYKQGELMDLIMEHESFIGNYEDLHFCYAPTQSLLQKWLRDEHKLCVEIQTPDFKDMKWSYTIHRVHKFGNYANESKEFDTYEEALEYALYDALKLI